MKNEKNPLVSVIMPVYNEEAYIDEAVQSILSQTYKNFELLLLDDASTDATLSRLEYWKEQDSRIKLFKHTKNKGVYVSRNECIEHSRGIYITSMGGDDIAHPEKLEAQVRFLQENSDVDLCICNLNIVNEQRQFIGVMAYPVTDVQIKSKVFRKNPFTDILMCKRKVLEEFKYPEGIYSSSGDYYLWLQVGTKYSYANVNKVLCDYRMLLDSVCHKNIRETEKNVFRIRLAAFKLGYQPSVFDIVYNILHFISFMILPSRWKFHLYYYLRTKGFI